MRGAVMPIYSATQATRKPQEGIHQGADFVQNPPLLECGFALNGCVGH